MLRTALSWAFLGGSGHGEATGRPFPALTAFNARSPAGRKRQRAPDRPVAAKLAAVGLLADRKERRDLER
ncbi:hypothetical protein, partial [Micromonospora fulviviridis]